MSEHVSELTSVVACALSPRAAKVRDYNNLASTEGLPPNHSIASGSTTPRGGIVPTAASFRPTRGASASFMPPPPPQKGGIKAKGGKIPAAGPKKQLPNQNEKKATAGNVKVKNDADIKAGAKSKHEVKAAPIIKLTDAAAENVTLPANHAQINANAATAESGAALPDNRQNDAGQDDGAKNVNSPPPPSAAAADSNPADATQKWVEEQQNLRAAADDEDVFEDEEEDDDVVDAEDVIKAGWEKVKETEDMNIKYFNVEQQNQIDIQAYKNQIGSLESQFKHKKEEKN